MRSFFFGAGRRLYGTLHEARGSARSTAVLLCSPGVQEYNMTHWAFRKLAGLLNREGLHVMRFDYSYTGDSDGDVADTNLTHQVEDIATAAEELKDQTGLRRVAVIGMRLGAALATQAVARGLRAESLLLWEPVFHGVDYIHDLERLDTEVSMRRLHEVHEPRLELGGYPFPGQLRDALAGIALKMHVPKSAGQVAMFLAEESPEATETELLWKRTGVPTRVKVVREQSGGVRHGAGIGDSAVLYTEMLDAIAGELAGPRAVAA
ncbi:MAG: alpha/beta fold hydrolase [Archangiaceae bacterium]|nr:alpha/beta fold hydrolase [Archangiaceae bacterium]